MWPRFHYIARNEWPPGPLGSFGLNGEKAAIQTVGRIPVSPAAQTEEPRAGVVGYTCSTVTLAHGGVDGRLFCQTQNTGTILLFGFHLNGC